MDMFMCERVHEQSFSIGVRFSFSAPLRDCPGSQCKGSSETSVQHFNDLFNYYHLHTNMNIFHKIISRNFCRVSQRVFLSFPYERVSFSRRKQDRVSDVCAIDGKRICSKNKHLPRPMGMISLAINTIAHLPQCSKIF